MAWPFSTAPAPSFDSAITAVPTSLTAVPNATSATWALGMNFANTTAALITIRVTNTAGDDILPTVDVPANSALPIAFAFLPCVGLKWIASATGVKGQIWGYV